MPTIYLAKDVYDEIVRLGQSPEALTNNTMRTWVRNQEKIGVDEVKGKVKRNA